jgi:hypothetical protein
MFSDVLLFSRRVIAFCVMMLCLSGCVIESPKPLHDASQKVPVHTIILGQLAAFKSDRGDYIFLQRKQGRVTVTLTKFSGAIGAGNSFETGLYQLEGLPSSVFVAVRSNNKTHEYVPFHFDRRGILILSPRKRTRVHSMEEFREALLNVPGRPVLYEKMGREEARDAYARYAKREDQRQKQAKTRAYENVSPYRTFDTGIRRLHVGDRVYWVRPLSTEVMQVREINISTGYVMLRRETDFVTAKVHHSRIMTAKQASQNGIKHGVATTRSAFCLARPKDCEW